MPPGSYGILPVGVPFLLNNLYVIGVIGIYLLLFTGSIPRGVLP